MSTSFGALLATHRIARGWSPHELGIRTGYGAGYVTRVERGRHVPSVETVGALATILDLNALDTRRLFVAAGYLPPGRWLVRDDLLVLAGGDA